MSSGTIKRGKVGTLEEFEKRFVSKRGGNNLGWPLRLGKDNRNSITVQFLTEPNEWIWYEQYWDPALNRPVIATDLNEESYAARNIKPHIIHLAPVIDVSTNQVVAFELKWSLVKQIKAVRENRLAKGIDFTSCNIELQKKGHTKDDTEYFALFDGSSDLDLSRYPVPNGYDSWENWLWAIVDKLAGNSDDDETSDELEDDNDFDEEVEVKPVRKLRKPKVNA